MIYLPLYSNKPLFTLSVDNINCKNRPPNAQIYRAVDSSSDHSKNNVSGAVNPEHSYQISMVNGSSAHGFLVCEQSKDMSALLLVNQSSKR